LEKEKPPIFALIQYGRQVAIQMLELERWGYSRKSDGYRTGEYAASPNFSNLFAYLFFEFVNNAKKRGKALLNLLLELIISWLPVTQ